VKNLRLAAELSRFWIVDNATQETILYDVLNYIEELEQRAAVVGQIRELLAEAGANRSSVVISSKLLTGGDET
jgi:hypothetical protein